MIANQQTEEAMVALSEAMMLYPENENEDIQRSIILLNEGKVLFTIDFLEKHEKDVVIQYIYALSLLKNKKFENAKEHFLKADPYNGYVNYFLGYLEDESERKDFYFERALMISFVEPLEFSYCLEIAKYFLNNNGTQELLVTVVQLFLQTDFSESNSADIINILTNLAEKIESIEAKQNAIRKIQELDSSYSESESESDESQGQQIKFGEGDERIADCGEFDKTNKDAEDLKEVFETT